MQPGSPRRTACHSIDEALKDDIKSADSAVLRAMAAQAWGGCRGSSPGGRGYPCAMWQLFHVLAANAPESSGVGVLWLTAVK